MLTGHQINDLIQDIISGYDPEMIYLFGSCGRGSNNAESDIDLFIVKNTSKRKIDRNKDVRNCIKNYPLTGLDLFVYTPAELQKAMFDNVNIGKEAVLTGKLMYTRPLIQSKTI